MFTVVLVNPEIPPNTGNIGRLTLGSGSRLWIVGQPGFDLDENTATRRAGLDYWDRVDWKRFSGWTSYRREPAPQRVLVTKFAERPYHDLNYRPGAHLIFGGETKGVPEQVQTDPELERVCLPMTNQIRAYNLANSVAVVLFEALRQIDPEDFRSTPYSDDATEGPTDSFLK